MKPSVTEVIQSFFTLLFALSAADEYEEAETEKDYEHVIQRENDYPETKGKSSGCTWISSVLYHMHNTHIN